MDFCVPLPIQKTQKTQFWVDAIKSYFESAKLAELSLDEAQDNYLKLAAQYELMYASYFVVSRKGHDKDINKLTPLMVTKTATKQKPRGRKSRFSSGSESDD